MSERTCSNCRFMAHIRDAIDETIRGDVTVGALWWKRIENQVLQTRYADALDECWRYPKAIRTFPEAWCGEWQPLPTKPETNP